MSGVGQWGSKGYTAATSSSSFLKTVLQCGVGRHVKQMKRSTIKFCESSASSLPVRNFIENDLVNFAKNHPSVVIYTVSEAHCQPQLSAEYLNGRKEVHNLDRMDASDIKKTLEILVDKSGLEIMRIRKDFHTDCPSIQGQWHPFMNKNYNINKELDSKSHLVNAWDPLPVSYSKYYRKNELDKLENIQKLSISEKKEMPLGKWGPVLKPVY